MEEGKESSYVQPTYTAHKRSNSITKAQSVTEDEAKPCVKANIARLEHQERYCKLRYDYMFAPLPS